MGEGGGGALRHNIDRQVLHELKCQLTSGLPCYLNSLASFHYEG